MKKLFIASVLFLSAFFFADSVGATVGGPTYIYNFRYNPEDKSIYYVSNSQSGRGCPPTLQKLSVTSGDTATVFSCTQGAAFLTENKDSNQWQLVTKFEEMTEPFERLIPIHLSNNNIVIDLTFARTENYGPDVNEILHTHFFATVYQRGQNVAEFPISGCNKNQPFIFAGYTIPSLPGKLIFLSSAKGDCFEGGYIGESLHIIDGVSGITNLGSAYPPGFSKWNEPLLPSEATLVVFEKDKVIENALALEKDENRTITLVVTAFFFLFLGVVLGKAMWRRKMPDSTMNQIQ